MGVTIYLSNSGLPPSHTLYSEDHTITDVLLMFTNTLFGAEEQTFFPIEAANVMYTRRGPDDFKILKTEFTFLVTYLESDV